MRQKPATIRDGWGVLYNASMYLEQQLVNRPEQIMVDGFRTTVIASEAGKHELSVRDAIEVIEEIRGTNIEVIEEIRGTNIEVWSRSWARNHYELVPAEE